MTEKEKQKALVLAKKLSNKFSLQEAQEFIKKVKNQPFFEDLKILIQMITDKKYKIDKKTYIIIAGAIAYAVLPTDIIPDFIPGVGFVDDAFVISSVIAQLREEIENYKSFKNEKSK